METLAVLNLAMNTIVTGSVVFIAWKGGRWSGKIEKAVESLNGADARIERRIERVEGLLQGRDA